MCSLLLPSGNGARTKCSGKQPHQSNRGKEGFIGCYKQKKHQEIVSEEAEAAGV